jgi:hypothetical protein
VLSAEEAPAEPAAAEGDKEAEEEGEDTKPAADKEDKKEEAEEAKGDAAKKAEPAAEATEAADADTDEGDVEAKISAKGASPTKGKAEGESTGDGLRVSGSLGQQLLGHDLGVGLVGNEPEHRPACF